MEKQSNMTIDNDDRSKREKGAFLTKRDPFVYDAFKNWLIEALLASKENMKKTITICEPYAGTNSLLKFLHDDYRKLTDSILADENATGTRIQYRSYDIRSVPESENMFPCSPILQRDTLFNIPDASTDIIVTNPPYLARNSARRRRLAFPFEYCGDGINRPADLYQIAIDTCLRATKWCCMLIPESFVTSRYDKHYVRSIISLPGDLFDDTDCPVCLALFAPENTLSKSENNVPAFELYNMNGHKVGTWNSIVTQSDSIIGNGRSKKKDKNDFKINFNIPDGEIGLHAIDGIKCDNIIRFTAGSNIPSDKIKQSSRSLTRIHINHRFNDAEIEEIIRASNMILNEWRNATNDILMTSFKGTMHNGRYRRRLSYDIAKKILLKATSEILD